MLLSNLFDCGEFIVCLLLMYVCRPQEGVKIAATDEEAKAEAANMPVDIDVQCQEILRWVIYNYMVCSVIA